MQPPFPDGCTGSYEGPNSRIQGYRGKLGKLMRLGHVMLDYSTLPDGALIDTTRRHMDRHRANGNGIPLVAIGHNKNFTAWSEQNLASYLQWASSQSDIVFSDYQTWHRAITG